MNPHRRAELKKENQCYQWKTFRHLNSIFYLCEIDVYCQFRLSEVYPEPPELYWDSVVHDLVPLAALGHDGGGQIGPVGGELACHAFEILNIENIEMLLKDCY